MTLTLLNYNNYNTNIKWFKKDVKVIMYVLENKKKLKQPLECQGPHGKQIKQWCHNYDVINWRWKDELLPFQHCTQCIFLCSKVVTWDTTVLHNKNYPKLNTTISQIHVFMGKFSEYNLYIYLGCIK